MKSKSQEQLDVELDQYNKEVSATINKAFDKGDVRLPLELVKSSMELAHRAHPALSGIASAISAIPPLKLAFSGIVASWDILHAIAIDKKSHVVTRAGRVGIGLGVIGLGIGALIAAPIAGILAVVVAGLGMGREFLDVATSISKYVVTRKEAVKEVNPTKQKIFAEKLTKKRNDIIKKSATAILAAVSVAGFALLIPPFTPIGMGILIATSAVGIAVKAGPPLVKFLAKKIAPVFNKFKARFFPAKGKEKDDLTEKEVEKESTTTKLSKQFPGQEKIAEQEHREEEEIRNLEQKWKKATPATSQQEINKQSNSMQEESEDEDKYSP